MVLTVSFALSSVTGLFCHRRLRIWFCLSPVGPTQLRKLDASVGASGPHDFAVRSNISRQRAVDRSQTFRSALRSHRAQNAAASTASHPASVTIMIRPSVWGGMAKVLEVIWGVRKQKYFFKQDWTTKITLIQFNKSHFRSDSNPAGGRLEAEEITSRCSLSRNRIPSDGTLAADRSARCSG